MLGQIVPGLVLKKSRKRKSPLPPAEDPECFKHILNHARKTHKHTHIHTHTCKLTWICCCRRLILCCCWRSCCCCRAICKEQTNTSETLTHTVIHTITHT